MSDEAREFVLNAKIFSNLVIMMCSLPVLETADLHAALREDKIFWAAQTCTLVARNYPGLVCLQFTPYQNHNEASEHIRSSRNDWNAAIVDLSKPYHQQRIGQLLQSQRHRLFYLGRLNSSAMINQVRQGFSGSMIDSVRRVNRAEIDDLWFKNSAVVAVHGELFLVIKVEGKDLAINVKNLAHINVV